MAGVGALRRSLVVGGVSGRFCGILRDYACVQVHLACSADVKHRMCFVVCLLLP